MRHAPSTMKITKEFIAGLKPTGQRGVFRDSAQRGLLLRVGASGRVTWAFDYRDGAGKRQTYTIGDATRIDPGEARKRLRALGDDPAAQRRSAKAAAAQAVVETEQAERRTVRKFLEGKYWNSHLKHARSGVATKKRIHSAWAPLLDFDMVAIDVDDVITHRNDRRETGVAPQTLNRDRIALLAMFNKAIEWNVIDRNPLAVPAFKPLETEDDKRVRWLGQRDESEGFRDEKGNKLSERARFMAALAHKATPEYLRRIVIVAMHTGLRRGEIFKLRWQDVLLQRATLTVRAAAAKSAKTRHIDLNADARAVFEEIENVRHISGYVFVNPDTGAPFTTLKKSWADLLERAQLIDFTFHDLRHDFASRLVQAGVALEVVRELLGHSSITLTERYAHLAPGQKRRAVALLETTA